MPRVLIVGATGLVGGHTLHIALADHRVAEVIAPTRRRLAPAPGLTNPVVDFTSLDPDSALWNVDAVVCALGTTMRTAGSRAAFRWVDEELPVRIARYTASAGARAYVLISSTGANPRSASFYLRVKGSAESELRRVGFESMTIVRPAGLLGARGNGRRSLNQLAVDATRVLGPVLPRRMRPVQASRVASVAVDAAVTAPAGVHIRESESLGRSGAR